MRGALGTQVAGSGPGVGRQHAGEDTGGLVEGLLLAREQGRAGGDQLVDRTELVQGPGLARLDPGEQAALGEQGAAERGDRRLAW